MHAGDYLPICDVFLIVYVSASIRRMACDVNNGVLKDEKPCRTGLRGR